MSTLSWSVIVVNRMPSVNVPYVWTVLFAGSVMLALSTVIR